MYSITDTGRKELRIYVVTRASHNKENKNYVKTALTH